MLRKDAGVHPPIPFHGGEAGGCVQTATGRPKVTQLTLVAADPAGLRVDVRSQADPLHRAPIPAPEPTYGDICGPTQVVGEFFV